MAAEPIKCKPPAPLVLRAYRAELHAGLVASWVRDAREAYWLAPRVRPPVTPAKLRAWDGPGCERLVAVDGSGRAIAYGEVNVLNRSERSYWLGHLIVDPQRRGGGVGRSLTRLLVQRAREVHVALRVTLVVFPENAAAIGCYESAGLVRDGYETHYFPLYRRHALMLRMVAAADPGTGASAKR